MAEPRPEKVVPAEAQRTRVLLIDESEDDALAVAFELGRGMQDIETRWAGDGQGMDTLIAQWQPHLLLTDVYLPRSEFLAELARIRAAWPMLPVVVVSGLVGEEAVAHLIKAGANDFVAKSGASRLPTVAKRELRDARERTERAALESQLRSQERLFLQVLEHLPVGVWIIDQKGTIQHVNPSGREIWEGARFVDIGGYTQYKGWWADTGLPIAPEQWGAARAILKGETSIGECVEIETFGGKRRVILNSAIPLRGDDGEAKGCFVVNQDITALHRSEQRLLGTERTLRALSQRLVETQEQERHWIAQELHDDIGQGIAAMRIQLARIGEYSQEPRIQALAAAALRSSHELNDRLRHICLGLRPPELDDFGLMAALRGVIADFGERPTLAVDLACEGPELRYPAGLETSAFRICQEAISNALRHSGCTSLGVSVRPAPGSLVVTVRDDGCGFVIESASAAKSRVRHLGLAGMKERAHSMGGELQIDSKPGCGTTVRLVIPLPDPAALGGTVSPAEHGRDAGDTKA